MGGTYHRPAREKSAGLDALPFRTFRCMSIPAPKASICPVGGHPSDIMAEMADPHASDQYATVDESAPLAPDTERPASAPAVVVVQSELRASVDAAAQMLPIDADQLPRGAAIGRYLVLSRLGAGGMGVVYAAYDPDLDRKVAIKLLRPRQLKAQGSTSGRMRLLREAQALARLSHPNVTTVYDVGTAYKQVFVAMEFVDGCTLRDWLYLKPRTLSEILGIFRRAGQGLVAAHLAGMVHRERLLPVENRRLIFPWRRQAGEKRRPRSIGGL